jgi:ATP phosphoribosyltransferase regulatory subunit
MSAWVLPDHIADVLPSEARHIEELRRDLLDTARCYGYELVMPPLLEHLESLLSGTGEALDLQTFKLVDQLSGRMMGLRADSTPQVARIDAHLLNRSGVTRLCYCGPVLHTRPDKPHATREPLQFGAEIYGHAGLEADLEILQLALDGLRGARVEAPRVDLADARIPRALLDAAGADVQTRVRVHRALAGKDAEELRLLSQRFAAAPRDGLLALVSLYGGADVLAEARATLPPLPGIAEALDSLAWLAGHLGGTETSFDLAACVFRCLRRRPATRWPVVAGMTRSARCSAATGRPWVSAWTSRRWSRPWVRGRCMPRSGRPGASSRNCARRWPRCAPKDIPWSACCPAMRVKSMSSSVIASCYKLRGSGS